MMTYGKSFTVMNEEMHFTLYIFLLAFFPYPYTARYRHFRIISVDLRLRFILFVYT